MILNCVPLQEQIKDEILREIRQKGLKPHLTIIQVGDIAASNRYIAQKVKHCNDVEIGVTVVKLPETISEADLMATILDEQTQANGIIVQLPLPQHIDESAVLEMIDPSKDVDGLTSHHKGLLYEGFAEIKPCTAAGTIEMLDRFNIPIEGMNVLIIGRSDIVGKPLCMMLLERNATVTVAHSKSDLQHLKRIKWDIVVGAIGRPKYLYGFNAGTLIDVGINVDESGKLCGDFDPENNYFENISPVPGGVGRMTIIGLIKNLVKLAEIQQAN